jgi:tetratricopeptide (TPR) repeat protein
MRLERIILFLLAAFLLVSAPGWPKFGISKTRARFVMHHPPAFHSSGRELRVEVNSIDLRTGALLVPRLQQFLEQALIRENLKVTPNAQTVLQCTLNQADASVQRERRSESVNVHTGEHTAYDKEGKARQVEDCENQASEVTYLVSSGRLLLNLTATETKTQTVLLTQLVQRDYRQESAIAGPKKCRGEGYSVAAGQLQDPPSILTALSDQAVADTVKMAAGHDEPREVLLAVDNELKSGNAQALGGNWQQALDTWTSASLRKSETEAARQYNLGVAHEVLAAAAMRNDSLDEAGTHLNEAEKCYAQALNLDPGEKYFRDTLTRLQRDRQVLQKELEHQFLEQAETVPTAPAEGAASAAPLLSPIPLEGWPQGEADVVHDYRVYVRTRVGAQTEEPNEAFKQKLLASAADYGVKQGVALQVLESEVKRFLVLRQGVEKYSEDFRDAAADGIITADERAMLRKRQQILRLSDAQVKQTEAQFQVREKE